MCVVKVRVAVLDPVGHVMRIDVLDIERTAWTLDYGPALGAYVGRLSIERTDDDATEGVWIAYDGSCLCTPCKSRPHAQSPGGPCRHRPLEPCTVEPCGRCQLASEPPPI